MKDAAKRAAEAAEAAQQSGQARPGVEKENENYCRGFRVSGFRRFGLRV